MRRILNDSAQLIRVYPHTILTPTVIRQALTRAQSSRMYAKFYTDKFFIQVNFMRDGSISVASNIRHQAFLQDLWKKNQIGWNLAYATSFVYTWMQLSRKVLH